MNKKISFLLVLFLILDACYTFYQFYYLPHDGDMAAIIAPAEWYSQVLQDPFGFSVFTKGEKYSGINRFFAHWSLGAYFKTVPLALQVFVNPLDSSYLASALARLGTYFLLIWLLAMNISGTGKLWKPSCLLAAALITPLFQTGGYFEKMNIIGHSITYSFFYEISLAVLLLYFLPFFRAFFQQKPLKLNLAQHILLFALAFILPFQGPLNAPLVLIICPATLLYLWWQQFRKYETGAFFSRSIQAINGIPITVLFHFMLIVLVSLYSFYVGTFNNENDYSVGLLERYSRLPKGIYQQMIQGNSFIILSTAICLNVWLLTKFRPEPRLFTMMAVTTIFCLLYIAMLPLGGYRSYRPNILSSHLLIPVTLSLVFFYGYTSWLLIREATFSWKKLYVAGIVLFSVLFSVAERPNDVTYRCEKAAIEQIAASPENFVEIDTWCGVMSWGKITNQYFSVAQGKVLQLWGVTTDAKTFTTGKQ